MTWAPSSTAQVDGLGNGDLAHLDDAGDRPDRHQGRLRRRSRDPKALRRYGNARGSRAVPRVGAGQGIRRVGVMVQDVVVALPWDADEFDVRDEAGVQLGDDGPTPARRPAGVHGELPGFGRTDPIHGPHVGQPVLGVHPAARREAERFLHGNARRWRSLLGEERGGQIRFGRTQVEIVGQGVPGGVRRRGFGALQRPALELEDENVVIRWRDRRDGRAELGQPRRHLVRDSSGILLRPELQRVASRSLADAARFQGGEGGIREHHCVSPQKSDAVRGILARYQAQVTVAPRPPIAARSLGSIGPGCESQHQSLRTRQGGSSSTTGVELRRTERSDLRSWSGSWDELTPCGRRWRPQRRRIGQGSVLATALDTGRACLLKRWRRFEILPERSSTRGRGGEVTCGWRRVAAVGSDGPGKVVGLERSHEPGEDVFASGGTVIGATCKVVIWFSVGSGHVRAIVC